MVALHLSNSKKILIVCASFLFGCSNGLHTLQKTGCPVIGDFIELLAEPSGTGIMTGDTLELVIRFVNKTPDTVDFYSRGVLFLATPLSGFNYESKFLNKTLELASLKSLPPKGEFTMVQSICIDPAFFKQGDNAFLLGYTAKELTGENRKYNTVCGSLQSLPFNVRVSR